MQKKGGHMSVPTLLSDATNQDYPRLFTYFDSLDLRFDALFLCQVFFLANLSTMLITLGRNDSASFLSVMLLSLDMEVLAVFL